MYFQYEHIQIEIEIEIRPNDLKDIIFSKINKIFLTHLAF